MSEQAQALREAVAVFKIEGRYSARSGAAYSS
jgi:hypothetical protein